MKKLIFAVLCFSILQVINAQEIEVENKYFLGGSVSFYAQKNASPFSILFVNAGIDRIHTNSIGDTKNTTFAINPYFGKEISQKLAVGAWIDYRIGISKAEDVLALGQANRVDFERNSNQLGIGLFTRHTLNPNNQFNFFIQPYVEYNLLNEEEMKDSNVTREEKATYFEAGLGLGVLYNVNGRIRATLTTGGLRYINGKWEVKNTDVKKDFSSFATTLNLSNVSLGVEIRI